MDISATSNVISQSGTLYRNEPLLAQEHMPQQPIQSTELSATETPLQKIQKLNAEIVNSRVVEHQSSTAQAQLTADEAVGSLIDVCV